MTKTHVAASAVQTVAAPGEILNVDIQTNLVDSPAIDLRGARGLIVRCLAGTATNLSIAFSDRIDGTYTALQNENDEDITLTLSGSKWKTVAKEVYFGHFAKIYGAAVTLQLCPKS